MLLVPLASLCIGTVTTVTSVAAQPATQMALCSSRNSIFGFAPWYACLPGANNGEPRLTKISDIFLIILPVLEGMVKAGAYVAAAYMFYMIILFITARGNASKAATAMGGIRDAVIGFIITLVAIAIVNFVANSFTG